MAEVDAEVVLISTDPNNDNNNDPNKNLNSNEHETQSKQKVKGSGRRSKFSTTEDLIISQEVAAAQAHLAKHGEVSDRFREAAMKANANPNFKHDLTGKQLQDRFKKLLDDFETRDAADRIRSGTGGEIGDLDDLLSDMNEARKDLVHTKRLDAEYKSEQEQKKLAAGRDLVLQSLKGRKGPKGKSSDDSEEERETPRKRRKVDVTDGMASIGEALKESDLARFELERERLAFEMKKFEQATADKAAERMERAADKAVEREERDMERRDRLEELKAQRNLMEEMRRDSAQQVQAMLNIMGSFMKQQNQSK